MKDVVKTKVTIYCTKVLRVNVEIPINELSKDSDGNYIYENIRDIAYMKACEVKKLDEKFDGDELDDVEILKTPKGFNLAF